MVKMLFRRPCHVPPCLINGEGGSTLFNFYQCSKFTPRQNDSIRQGETDTMQVENFLRKYHVNRNT